MADPTNKPGEPELSANELDAVTGGTVVDTIVGVATQIWKTITNPAPTGVKGESKDDNHKDWII